MLAAGGTSLLGPASTAMVGGFGYTMLSNSFIDWSVAANRSAFKDGWNNPFARTPYSSIAGTGIAPYLEVHGSKGNLDYGEANPANPKTLMIQSWRARWILK
ncbi:hypothetical protein [Sphingomonas bacterium]|uniref:hypothetical protein n=1 Tax=Sphingomonas bacterium TaxID=1895847 RepID=UPI0015758E02|nr:hypothetical protein [Sphingomonas bacterium]